GRESRDRGGSVDVRFRTHARGDYDLLELLVLLREGDGCGERREREGRRSGEAPGVEVHEEPPGEGCRRGTYRSRGIGPIGCLCATNLERQTQPGLPGAVVS